MSVSTVTLPLRSSRARAADFSLILLRKAAATPMPTSQRLSRVIPVLGLRFFQPNLFVHRSRHSLRRRCEKDRSGVSGFHCVSFRERNEELYVPISQIIPAVASSMKI